MKVTYIGHSSFLLEWENCYFLFDYYTGVIPELDPEKKLFVFASHKHGDHYNPEIFRLSVTYPKVEYILSSDIRIKSEDYLQAGCTEEVLERVISVKAYQEYELKDLKGDSIRLKTLKSTDLGVAFLLQYQGKTIYHAGDLHQWVWKEETKQENNNMTARFLKEIETLRDIDIDLAFTPLDPRQEEWYYLGLEALLTSARVRYVFPMHFWGKPEIIAQFKQEREATAALATIMDVMQEGQSWDITI